MSKSRKGKKGNKKASKRGPRSALASPGEAAQEQLAAQQPDDQQQPAAPKLDAPKSDDPKPDDPETNQALAAHIRRHPLSWIAPGLLVLFATTQVTISKTSALSSWKGGGFGMFASNDHASTRLLDANGTTIGGREVHIRMKSSSKGTTYPRELRRQLSTFPTEGGLRRLAGKLLTVRLISNKRTSRRTYRLPVTYDLDEPDSRYIKLRQVTLQFWTRQIDVANQAFVTRRVGPEVTAYLDAADEIRYHVRRLAPDAPPTPLPELPR